MIMVTFCSRANTVYTSSCKYNKELTAVVDDVIDDVIEAVVV